MPTPEQELTGYKAAVGVLTEQRNNAMDAVASMAGRIAILEEEKKQLEGKINELEVQIKDLTAPL